MLPMPYEQEEGLAEYFYSFIGRQTAADPVQNGIWKLRYSAIPSATILSAGTERSTSHTLTWNKAYGDDGTSTPW